MKIAYGFNVKDAQMEVPNARKTDGSELRNMLDGMDAEKGRKCGTK